MSIQQGLRPVSSVLVLTLIFAALIRTSSAQSGRASSQQDRPQRAVEESQQRQASPARETQRDSHNKDAEQTVGPDEVVKITTDLTSVLLTAVDRDKRFVTSLKQTDIQLVENGVPQEISTFERETNLPLSLGILIDVSKSEEFSLPNEKAAAREFVQSVIRPEKDQAAVISFTGDPTLEQPLTNRVLALERAIDRIEIVLPPEEGAIVGANGQPIPILGDLRIGSTAIWDAIWSTSNEVLGQTPEHTRRAIILLTDGEDTSSRTKRQEAIDRAVKDNVAIYSIGIGDRRNYGINEGALKKLSERTGGRAFFPENEMDLRAAFSQIQAELRSQYLLAYTSTNRARDGSFRKIQIDVINPELKKDKLRLLYRDGYFAKSSDGKAKGKTGRTSVSQ